MLVLLMAPAGLTRKQRFLGTPSVANLGSASWYIEAYRPGVSAGMLASLASTGKMLVSAVSQRALFQVLGFHTKPGCPVALTPLPLVPTAPLSARYDSQKLVLAAFATAAVELVGIRRTPLARFPITT